MVSEWRKKLRETDWWENANEMEKGREEEEKVKKVENVKEKEKVLNLL